MNTTAIFIKLGVIGLCSIVLKMILIYLDGEVGYYVDLLFHILILIAPISFFILFLIATYVQKNERTKSVRGYSFITGSVFIILIACLYFFLPQTVSMLEDVPFSLKHEYEAVQGEVVDLRRSRQDATFKVQNVLLKTELISIRNVLSEGKKVKAIYLPNSKFLINLMSK
ncbi:MAG TPA: hypothetical protein VF941_11340 [Clostridia bacterium]